MRFKKSMPFPRRPMICRSPSRSFSRKFTSFQGSTLQPESNLSMLRSWIGSGAVRSLCVRRLTRSSLSSPKARFSSAPTRYLQPPASADRVPLRKQLKQEAKALRSHKKQRKETEEASRQEWELTVGVEIHAQLDTESKLFSR